MALPLLTALLLTQAAPADSPSFHRGEWVAQFGGGLNFASLGFVKFRAPTKALVVDIRVEGGHGEDLVTDSTGTHWGGVGSHADVVLRFGWRRYHAAGSKVVGFHSLGFLAGFTHSVSVSPGERSIANGWNSGVFGDIGASYFLTPRLSVGATAGAQIRYTDEYEHSYGGRKRRVWNMEGGMGGVGFVAALYF